MKILITEVMSCALESFIFFQFGSCSLGLLWCQLQCQCFVNFIRVCAPYDVILVPAISDGLIYAFGYGYVIWDDAVLADGYFF
jgi:hypothetical protein